MPVKTLIEALETSFAENDYNHIVFHTTDKVILCELDAVSYATHYFFRVKTDTGEVLVNINNLQMVECKNEPDMVYEVLKFEKSKVANL